LFWNAQIGVNPIKHHILDAKYPRHIQLECHSQTLHWDLITLWPLSIQQWMSLTILNMADSVLCLALYADWTFSSVSMLGNKISAANQQQIIKSLFIQN